MDGDLDRDVLAVPVVPDLQLECVEELPLKLAWKFENVQAYLRQLGDEVSPYHRRLPDRPGQRLQLGRDGLSPLGVLGELTLQLGAPLGVGLSVSGTGHLLERQDEVLVGRVQLVELLGVGRRRCFVARPDRLV
ncbi:MAG TPA: hypothetical protein VFM54_02785, partial [Micromonosporaceae bacterium]|nr:hypothetical protein [Micromonosporaceae bacterium]